MSFFHGVMRMLGAVDDETESEETLEYPDKPERSRPEEGAGVVGGVINMPEPGESTMYVVRPEYTGKGKKKYNLKRYAEYLMTRQSLVLDINVVAEVDVDEAKRVVDYLSGVVEAVDGSVWEITKNIFIFVPSNVKLAGDPLTKVEVV